MNFLESLEIFHLAAKEIPCLTGKGAPTTQTEGATGVLYMDTDTGGLYKCRGGAKNGYLWELQPGGFTEADKAEIVGAVLDALRGEMVPGYVDSANNVVITGLPDGSYTVRYEMADGSTIDIGSLEVADESAPAYTNQIPVSTDVDGDLFVGTNGEAGYKTGYRLSLSSGSESAQEGTEATGFIPATKNSVLRIKDIAYAGDTVRGVVGYDASHTKLPGNNGVALSSLFTIDEGNGVTASRALSNFPHFYSDDLAFIRLCSTDINENSILTVDEPIV